jgi:hypothetical protein
VFITRNQDLNSLTHYFVAHLYLFTRDSEPKLKDKTGSTL